MKKKRSKNSSKGHKDKWVTKNYQAPALKPKPTKLEGLFSISLFAKKLGVHPQTLRNWERAHLLYPRRIGRDRVYGNVEYEKALLIQRFANRGISLKGIEELFKEIS